VRKADNLIGINPNFTYILGGPVYTQIAMSESPTPVLTGKMPWISPPAANYCFPANISVKTSTSASSKTSAFAPATASTNSFNQILSTALLTGGSSLSGGAAGSSNTLLPLMLVLLEELLAKTVENPVNTLPNAAQALSSIQSEKKATIVPTEKASSGSSTPQGRPVGGVLTQNFHPGHNGLDFGVPVGTQIKATMNGKVISAGWNNQGYGNLVIVENGPYRTYYAHLSSIPVKVGQEVSAGATVGLSGNTGNSTGPHLHYEVRKDSKVINPTAFTLV
jgi:murein DD-endopeptidase MepM/ murein hydrolase activator NlpD